MTQFVDPDPVERYFYHNNKNGKRCPRDNTSLEANVGRYGMYVCCCAVNRHYYKLDEIQQESIAHAKLLKKNEREL